jgi:hypothetical protein
MTRKKSFDDPYEDDALEYMRIRGLQFGAGCDDFMKYIQDLQKYTYELEERLEELESSRNEIEKLLALDKSSIIEALVVGQESVRVGKKKFSIDTAVEKYWMELEEVVTRVEDQKLVGSKGNVIQVKRLLLDFICVLRAFTDRYEKIRSNVSDLEEENNRLKMADHRSKNRIDNLEEHVSRAEAQIHSEREENDRLIRRVGELLNEIDELKKPMIPTELNQKRTIQKE